MNFLSNNPEALWILFAIVLSLFVFQVVVLLKIRNMLQQISFYIESISRFFYRVGLSSLVKDKKQSIPRTCQFCKNRLSFIHMSEIKGEVEDFYYKCQLRNTEIKLDDTCEQFDKEEAA